MIILKDDGGGVTQRSLEFWEANKAKIGSVRGVEVEDKLRVEFPLEYTFRAIGVFGDIYLSGCNCGYLGEGPHGTAKILVELGLDSEEAERMVAGKVVAYKFPLLSPGVIVRGDPTRQLTVRELIDRLAIYPEGAAVGAYGGGEAAGLRICRPGGMNSDPSSNLGWIPVNPWPVDYWQRP